MNIKKLTALALSGALSLTLLSGCGKKEGTTLKVGATPAPHAEILTVVKDILAKEDITLEIVEFTDYRTPNDSTEDGSIDANYFQHITYMNNYNEENGTHLVSVGAIHYEPFGLYPSKAATLAELSDGALIGVPNDTTNEARALLLLEQAGLITLKDGVGINATKLAIAAFIVPYIFAFNPDMLLVDTNAIQVLQISATSLIGLFGVAAALNGHLFRPIAPLVRAAMALGGLAMMFPGHASDIAGLVLVLGAVFYQRFTAGRAA